MSFPFSNLTMYRFKFISFAKKTVLLVSVIFSKDTILLLLS